MQTPLEVSVVIPCLNEALTVSACVSEALAALRSANIDGEVIVSDNGSTDGSQTIALTAGARVVTAERRGYGAALMTGIDAAHGRYIVMGDADGSYDFGATPQLVAALRAGAELAQGCRLPTGGGRVDSGAMPWLHRYVGNPGLTWLARWMFGTPVHDVYCGLRGFSKARYKQLGLRCTGMEFATEMIIKAALHHIPTAEVPITLRRDGRAGRAPHLRTFRDGWRTLRLYLLFSPRWVFVFPGLVLCFSGIGLGSMALIEANIGPATLGAHSLLVASMALITGQQALWIGLFTRYFATIEGIAPENHKMTKFRRLFNLEASIGTGLLSMILGLGLISVVLFRWMSLDYGPLEYPQTLKFVIPGITLVVMGLQVIMGGFALSLISLERK